MRRLLTILIFTGGLFCEQATGQIVTDRPDQTEGSSTVPKGALQLESGMLVRFEGEGQEEARQILLPTTLFRYGLANGIELRVLNQFETLKIGAESVQGISDVEIGTKIRLIKDEDKNVEMAFLSHLIFPTGANNVTGGKIGISNKLSVSHGINENLGVGYNLGYNYFGEGNGDLIYTLVLGIQVNDKVAMYIEPFGEIINLKDAILNFDTGLTYLVNDNLQFDFSFGTGLNWKMNYMSLGCSWLIEKE